MAIDETCISVLLTGCYTSCPEELNPMEYADFELRAWQIDEAHLGVMVHNSPAGDMRQPVNVEIKQGTITDILKRFTQGEWYGQFTGSEEVVEVGRELTRLLLPMPVYTLLVRSQERIGPSQGLRIRLCLDDELMDCPWELLYRPDQDDATLSGFLVLDPQISFVREAPMRPLKVRTSQQQQRMIFAGAFWHDEKDPDRWRVREEYQALSAALEPVKELLAVEFVDAKGESIETALSKPAAIFYYSGHTASYRGRAYLVKEVEGDSGPDPMYCEELAIALRKASTRIAVLSACNSGHWCVAEPLLQMSLPVLIGTRGVITNVASQIFSQSLFNCLAVGLSLDEAVFAARLNLLDAGGYQQAPACALAAFIVYMRTKDPILIPRPQTEAIREKQRTLRRQVIINVTQNIGTVSGGTVTGVDVEELTTGA
jgi:hypothetical protein